MKTRILMNMLLWVSVLSVVSLSCNVLMPSAAEEPTLMPDTEFQDQPALPNDSGIEGVKIYPDRPEYHTHVNSLPESTDPLPPVFGAHYDPWQNCGIYDQPIELGLALHSMEHGAVWLTYSPDLGNSQIAELQDLVRGHGFALMSPYPPQTKPVVLTAWGMQLVIDSLPDERISHFIDYYENGPQNPEPGAPCSGAIGEPLP